MASSEPRRAFVTGVSRGFGKAIGERLLAEGFEVYGCSRSAPPALLGHPRFRWCRLDLADTARIQDELARFLDREGCARFDLVLLNAGMFGPSPRGATEVALDAFRQVLDVNLVANKALLDALLSRCRIDQCLASASIAGVRLRAGTLSYGVSKAALNALLQVYAQEHPETFFAVLGLCNMRTGLLEEALAGERVAQFPDIVALRERATQAGYVTPPETRAEQVWQLFRRGFGERLESGRFCEIRSLVE